MSIRVNDNGPLAIFNFKLSEAIAMGTYDNSVDIIMKRVCDHFEFMEDMYNDYTHKWSAKVCVDVAYALTSMIPSMMEDIHEHPPYRTELKELMYENDDGTTFTIYVRLFQY